jgi:hypothetical protein
MLALIDQGDHLRSTPLPRSYQALKLHYPASQLDVTSFGGAGRALIASLKYELQSDANGNACVDDVYSFIEEWETTQLITEPPFAEAQQRVFLFAWFCIWLPITIWAKSSVWSTIILYPFISFVLWGTTILRKWLGSPWDHDRSFKESQHEHWNVAFKASIRKICIERYTLKYPDSTYIF